MWDNKTIAVKVLRTADMTKMELRVDVLELADLKVAVLRLAVLRVAVVDVAEIGGADPSQAKTKVADLRVAETRGAETLLITARMVLLNTTWSSLLHLECDLSMQTLFNRL
jgi:uncharacterized protein YjbI with pentapeptide repeats